MTAKAAKTYLNKAHHLRRQCEALERKILLIRTKAEGLRAVTYNKDKIQISPTNVLEDAVLELDHLEKRYRRMITKYTTEIETRIQQIESLPDPRQVEVLMLRYIYDEPAAPGGQMTFDDIADTMHYAKITVLRIHGQALQEFSQRYKMILNDTIDCGNMV